MTVPPSPCPHHSGRSSAFVSAGVRHVPLTQLNSTRPTSLIAFWPRPGSIHAKSITIFYSAFLQGPDTRALIHYISHCQQPTFKMSRGWLSILQHSHPANHEHSTQVFFLPLHALSHFSLFFPSSLSLSLSLSLFLPSLVVPSPCLCSYLFCGQDRAGQLNMPCSHLKRCHCAGGAGACRWAPIDLPDARSHRSLLAPECRRYHPSPLSRLSFYLSYSLTHPFLSRSVALSFSSSFSHFLFSVLQPKTSWAPPLQGGLKGEL